MTEALQSLPVVTLSSGFQYPAVYSFPPFFTRQPKATTLAAQLAQWSQLVLSYCRYHRIFRLDLGQGSLAHELWRNQEIDRGVDVTFQSEIIATLAQSGSVAYDPPITQKSPLPAGCFVYFRKPEEWAEVIYTWISEQGMLNSILTFYELTTGGDLAHTTEFRDLPYPILRQAMTHLAKTGRAQVFKGSTEDDGDGQGVKFFPA